MTMSAETPTPYAAARLLDDPKENTRPTEATINIQLVVDT